MGEELKAKDARIKELEDIAQEMARTLQMPLKGLVRMFRTGNPYHPGDIAYLLGKTAIEKALKRAREAGIGEKDE